MPKDPIDEQFAVLLDAIRRKEPLAVIRGIVESNPTLVRKETADKRLLLHHAVRHGSPLELVRFLVVQNPEALLAKTADGRLPLHFAAESATGEVAKYLAEAKKEAAHEPSAIGWLPLHTAARYASPEVVDALIKAGREALKVPTLDGSLPLHIAAQHAPKAVVKILTEGWDEALLMPTRDGSLPLHNAARQGRLDVVRYLVAKNEAALQGTTIHGWSPLHVAARYGSLEVVELLAGDCNEMTADERLPLHVAAQYAKVEVVECLYQKNPEALHAASRDGWLPIHFAARFAPLDVVEFLGDKDPQTLQRTTDSDRYPLHNAAQSGNPDVVKYLLDRFGQAIHEADDGGALPLHIAAETMSLDVVTLLVDANEAALLHPTDDGSLPLHIAALHAPEAVVKYLVTKSADALFHPDRDGCFPLHVAARRAPSGIVQCLASAWPAALSTANYYQQRPVDVARHFANLNALEWLESEVPVSFPSTGSNPTPAFEPQDDDRARLCEVVDSLSRKPAIISVSYVESIRTETVLGRGVFGTVYKGQDSKLGRDFAIKSIKADLLRWGSKKELQAAVQTIKTEQEALSHFRHPNIAAMFGHTDLLEGETKDRYYLLYELAEKGSLDKFLMDDLGRSRLGTFQRRLQIAIDALTAIRFLHEGSKDKKIRMCVHRDIKSANIVIKRDFTAQLIDCGLAKFVDDDSDKTTGGKGTHGYMCPEYLKTCTYTAASDIYSFGVVMIELWTGRLQNSKDQSGAKFNFGSEFIDQSKPFVERMDGFMDMDKPLPRYARRYTSLAVKCIKEKSHKRPAGDKLLIGLKDIFERCSHKQRKVAARSLSASFRASASSICSSFRSSASSISASFRASRRADICLTCRTMPSIIPHEICALCLVRKELREAFASLSKQIEGSTCTLGTQIDGVVATLSQQIDASSENARRALEMASTRMDGMIRALAHLDRRLNNPVPRMFVIVPADKSFKRSPKSWFLDFVQKKFYMHFVCSVTRQAVSSPVTLKVPSEWIRRVAPVLAVSLVMIEIATEAVPLLHLKIPKINDTVGTLLKISSNEIGHMMEGLSSFLTESDRELVDRVRTKTLSAADVEMLNGAAYELVVEKALDPNEKGWRFEMEPVRVPPSEQVIWVSKAEAANPKYEVVR